MAAAYGFLAAVALAASIMVVASRRTFHSALYLVVSFLAVAGIFLVLGAELLAAVQVIVYAGSVVVLFVFVIMTAGYRESSVRRSAWWWLGLLAGVAVILGELVIGLIPFRAVEAMEEEAPTAAAVQAELARLLFSEWLVALEVLSLVILAVMVGIAALRREDRERR